MPDLSAGMVSKLKGQLPAPLQRVLGSTGLNVQAGEAHEGANNLPAIASVNADSVNTVDVQDGKKFASSPQTLGHEAVHLWQNNLPPTMASKIPQDGPGGSSYAVGAADLPAMRASGKTLATVPREMAPSIIQHYIANGGANAPAALQKIYDPWVQDMKNTPLSTILPTQPGQVGISTTPRPPMADPSTYQPSFAKAQDTMAVPNPKGLVAPGNLPIWNRPTVKNADGSHSSEYSTSFQDDNGHEVLVPTVVNGRFLTPNGKKPPEGSAAEKTMFKQAWKYYQKTGQHLGKFDNPDNADAYAGILHNRGSN